MKKILFVVAILGCVNVSAFAVTKCLNTSFIFNSCSNYSGAGSDFSLLVRVLVYVGWPFAELAAQQHHRLLHLGRWEIIRIVGAG